MRRLRAVLPCFGRRFGHFLTSDSAALRGVLVPFSLCTELHNWWKPTPGEYATSVTILTLFQQLTIDEYQPQTPVTAKPLVKFHG